MRKLRHRIVVTCLTLTASREVGIRTQAGHPPPEEPALQYLECARPCGPCGSVAHPGQGGGEVLRAYCEVRKQHDFDAASPSWGPTGNPGSPRMVTRPQKQMTVFYYDLNI